MILFSFVGCRELKIQSTTSSVLILGLFRDLLSVIILEYRRIFIYFSSFFFFCEFSAKFSRNNGHAYTSKHNCRERETK